jgi:tetratricopeptide (TPR) repeat protein
LKVLARILLLAIAGLLVWRIVASGMSDYYVDRLKEGDAAAAEKALAWNSHHPAAALRRGIALREADPGQSDDLLRRAYLTSPGDGSALVALALRADNDGDRERAQALIEKAADISPADPTIQKQVAAYWIKQENLEQALRHWSRALEARPSERSNLFPLFLSIAEDARARGALATFAASPPAWWDGFFREVAQRALDTETVRALYATRRAAPGAPLSQDEREAYIARLQRDGRITEAYLVWVNGLSEHQRAYLGILNNGGFEVEPTNVGFGWHVRRTRGVTVNTAKTHGIDGERALHMRFKRREKRFGHLFQPLFLDPATYRLTGRTRTDSLDSIGGLKWIVRCNLPETAVLGESERFLGSGDWRAFSFEFEVPETCSAQELRLVSAGTRAFEHKISGAVWYDTMAIRKIALPTPPKPPVAEEFENLDARDDGDLEATSSGEAQGALPLSSPPEQKASQPVDNMESDRFN